MRLSERGLRDRVGDRLEERLPRLAPEVVEALIRRDEAVDRADVDDRAPARAGHRAADHLAGDDDADDVDVDDALERVERDVLERPDLARRRVRRRVDRGGVDEHVRRAPVRLDERERSLDGRAVGHVAGVRADRPLLEPACEAGGTGARLGRRDRGSRPACPRAASAAESSAPSWPMPPVTTATRPERSNRDRVRLTARIVHPEPAVASLLVGRLPRPRASRRRCSERTTGPRRPGPRPNRGRRRHDLLPGEPRARERLVRGQDDRVDGRDQQGQSSGACWRVDGDERRERQPRPEPDESRRPHEARPRGRAGRQHDRERGERPGVDDLAEHGAPWRAGIRPDASRTASGSGSAAASMFRPWAVDAIDHGPDDGKRNAAANAERGASAERPKPAGDDRRGRDADEHEQQAFRLRRSRGERGTSRQHERRRTAPRVSHTSRQRTPRAVNEATTASA